MKRATMELGGHAPAIIFKDADVASAAKILAAAKYRNAGQVCISPTRMLVQDEVFREFVDKFVEGARAMKVGNGMDPDSKMGSLANPRRVIAIEGMVQDAVSKGATLETGGHRVGNKGYFFEPTVVSDVPKDARAMNEEPFGPLALISRFSTFDEVGRGSQPPALRVGVLRFHQFDQDRDRDRSRDRGRHGFHQQLRSGTPRGAVRRHQGFRLRLRRRHRGDGRLFQHQVHHPDRGVSRELGNSLRVVPGRCESINPGMTRLLHRLTHPRLAGVGGFPHHALAALAAQEFDRIVIVDVTELSLVDAVAA